MFPITRLAIKTTKFERKLIKCTTKLAEKGQPIANKIKNEYINSMKKDGNEVFSFSKNNENSFAPKNNKQVPTTPRMKNIFSDLL